MDDIEQIRERLDNIRGVEPIISSLRTIAAGSWRVALRRLRAAEQYLDNLSAIFGTLAAHLFMAGPLKRPWSRLHPYATSGDSATQRPLMVVIASERGLCGSFNDVVLRGSETLISQQEIRSGQAQIATLGRQAELYFRARGIEPLVAQPLPLTRVASLETAQSLSRELLELLVSGQVDSVYVIYSPYRGSAVEQPVARRWLPLPVGEYQSFRLDSVTARPPQAEPATAPAEQAPAERIPTQHPPGTVNEAPSPSSRTSAPVGAILPTAALWPPPIIETDIMQLWQVALRNWALASLYKWVVESAASEQAARYRAMEAASSNLSTLIDELTLRYHTARQHAITMEMLDLVGGSGLLKGRDPGARTRR